MNIKAEVDYGEPVKGTTWNKVTIIDFVFFAKGDTVRSLYAVCIDDNRIVRYPTDSLRILE